MEEKTQLELQLTSPAWIPSTPLKPIAPTTRLICQRIQENEVCTDVSSGSGLPELGFARSESGGSCGGAGMSCISSELATAADAASHTGPDRSSPPRLAVNHPTTCAGGYVCDLNKLPVNEEDKVARGSTPFFAPITPVKAPAISEKGDRRSYRDYKEVTRNGSSEEGGDDPSIGESQHDSPKKIPRRKARRKKHRPKVVKEGKQQRMQRMAMVSTEKPPVKRKYVRRKDTVESASLCEQMAGDPSDQQNQAKNTMQTISPTKSASAVEILPINSGYVKRKVDRKFMSLDDRTGESNDQQNPSKKTCRKALYFDKNEQPVDEAAINNSARTRIDIKVPAETSKPISTEQSGIKLQCGTESTNVKNHSSNVQSQISGVSATEGNIQLAIEGNRQPEKSDAYFVNEFLRFTHVFVRRLKSNTVFLGSNGLSYDGSINQIDVQSNNSSKADKTMAGAEYPEVPDETRIEKVLLESTTRETKMPCEFDAVVEQSHCLTTTTSGLVDVPQIMLDGLNDVGETRTKFKGRKELFGCESQLGQRDWLTKKRSRLPIRVRDPSSLTLSIRGNRMFNNPSKQSLTGSKAPTTCMEALLTDIQGTMSRKKRTKKELSETYSTYSSDAIEDNPNLYGSMQSGVSASNHPSGARPEWRKHVLFIDALVKKLDHLDINKESIGNFHGQLALICHDMANQERAIAIYNRDGPIMSVPRKKKRPRAKVEIDDETTRVWKLLLKNIENEGIDGTDEDKERWWKEERKVFKGRADTFIARMHLVQGDRRFSPWKGSVVDSVVGVFLTQNVSDHLSSSAFISLASRFPSKLNQEYYDEAKGPTFYDPDASGQVMKYPRNWTQYMVNHNLSDQHSVIIKEIKQSEETEVVYNDPQIGRENCSFSLTSGSQSHLTGLSGNDVELLVNFTGKTSADFLRKDAYHITEGCFQESGSHLSSSSRVTSQNHEHYISTNNASKTEASLTYNSEAEDFRRGSHFACRQFMENATFMQLSQMPLSKALHGSFFSEVENELSNQNQDCALKTPADFMYDLGWTRHKNASTNSPSDQIIERMCYRISGQDNSLSQSSKNEKLLIFHDYLTRNGTSIIDTTTTLPDNTLRQSIQQGCPNYGDQEYLSLGSAPNVEPKVFYEVHQVGYNRMQLHSYLESLLPGNPGNVCMTMVPEGSIKEHKEASCMEKQGSSLRNNSHGKNKETPSEAKSRRTGRKLKDDFDWDGLRKRAEIITGNRVKTPNTMDSVNWEAVRSSDVNAIADAIRDRGMNNVLAERIQDFLNRLVKEHGSIDLEWLRDIQPDEVKEYLLSIRGLGLKSVECVRLLTLHHLAFPVDTNVGRIAVRLGWVPLQPLPESLQLHLLELYPVLESIQKYLWPRLCKLDQRTLYELHYQMITFGKVFCTKSKPNCNACPMRGECRHFASAFASARLALPGPEEKSVVVVRGTGMGTETTSQELPLAITLGSEERLAEEITKEVNHSQPIIEEPMSPEPESKQTEVIDIEDFCWETFDEIPTIKLDVKEFSENIQNYMHQHMDLQEHEMSKALVALNPEAASIPAPKLKNMSRLRTEHLVYEIPEDHPLMNGLEKLEVDDPSKYLLAIWTPGETATSFQPPERRCNFQDLGSFCNETTCFSCNNVREADAKTIRGTFLIPCRTAMRGSFPLNGTYFQVNEVFADHETSLNPIYVPRSMLWKLQRRTVYFGTSISTIFKGLSTEGIQHCFWKGYVCVRGFDRRLRAPRPLVARLHLPASSIPRTTVKNDKRNLNRS